MKKKKKKAKDYGTPSLDRGRPERIVEIPAETRGQALLACVNRNPYLCLSSTDVS